GLGQGIIILLLSPLLKAPQPGEVAPPKKPKVGQSARDFSPGEMLKTPLFWALYLMFTMVAAGGLMATAQLGPIARDFGLDKMQVVFLGIAGTTLVMAGIVDNILNGIARPFFGWVSDNIGREPTMFIAFGGGPLAAWLVSLTGGWESVFWVSAVMDLAAAVMALLVLRPMRVAHHASVSTMHAAAQAAK